MRIKNNCLFGLIYTISLTSCTKIFFVKNDSDRFQSMRIVYKNHINCEKRNNSFIRFEKNGVIRNVKQISNDSLCAFNFELIPAENLPLTSFIQLPGIVRNKRKEKFVCIPLKKGSDIVYDTILYKKGDKETINRFTEKSKFFGILGRKNYVYYFK